MAQKAAMRGRQQRQSRSGNEGHSGISCSSGCHCCAILSGIGDFEFKTHAATGHNLSSVLQSGFGKIGVQCECG
jgi:hypothetical protein